MEEYTVDFSGVSDKKSFHARLKEYLPLPDWYGGNLDALFDSLTDLNEICIYFRNWEPLKETMPAYFDNFRHVIADAQMEVPGLFCFFEETEAQEPKAGGEAPENKDEEPRAAGEASENKDEEPGAGGEALENNDEEPEAGGEESQDFLQ